MAYSPESDYYEGSYISDAVPAAVESHPAWDHQTYCLQDVSLGQPSVLPYADYHSQPLDHTTSWLTMNPQSLQLDVRKPTFDYHIWIKSSTALAAGQRAARA